LSGGRQKSVSRLRDGCGPGPGLVTLVIRDERDRLLRVALLRARGSPACGGQWLMKAITTSGACVLG
jgi:hypothetical protein